MSRALKYRNILAHVSSCCSGSTVHHTPNLPPVGSTQMTLRRPKNAPLARNPTLAKTNLLIAGRLEVRASALPFPLDYLLILPTLNLAAVLCPVAFLFLPILAISRPSTYYIYFACNIFYFLRIHVNLLASTFVSFDCFARSGLFATRERGHPLSCGPSDSVGLVTLVLKRSSPSPSSGLSYRPQVHPHPSPPRPDDAAVIVRTGRVYRPPSFVYFYFYFYFHFYFCSSAPYEYYAPDAGAGGVDARYPAYDVANSDDVAADARDPTDAADDARTT
ncbi:hypothetical protein FB107DRAFT_294935 [Schizophyllum commune]